MIFREMRRRKQELSRQKVADILRKTDKKRSNYYEYRTNRRWGEASHYDLCIDVSRFGIDNCVELIEKYIELK